MIAFLRELLPDAARRVEVKHRRRTPTFVLILTPQDGGGGLLLNLGLIMGEINAVEEGR